MMITDWILNEASRWVHDHIWGDRSQALCARAHACGSKFWTRILGRNHCESSYSYHRVRTGHAGFVVYGKIRISRDEWEGVLRPLTPGSSAPAEVIYGDPVVDRETGDITVEFVAETRR